ncbi:MAG: hypothetical protein ABFD52_08765 [Acidobacteriota bacterium]
MKMRGLILGLLLATVAVAFIFFAKVGKDGQGGLQTMTGKYAESRISLTKVNLETLSREIQSYAAESDGRLPETLEEMRRLHPAAAAVTDAWGRKIRYERLSDSGFRLRSAGPDGAFGTGDDITGDF